MHSIVFTQAADEQAVIAVAETGISRFTEVTRRFRNAALLAGASATVFVAGPAWANPATSANNANFSQTTPGAFSQTVPDGVCAVVVNARGGGGASAGTTAALGGVGGGGAIINARFNVLSGQAVTGAVASGGGVGNASLTAANNGTGTANGGSGGLVGGGSTTLHRGGGGGGSTSISVGGVKMVEAGGGGGGGAAHQGNGTTNPLGRGGSGGFTGIAPGVVAVGVNGNVGNNVTNNGGQGGQTAGGGAGGDHTAVGGPDGLAGGGIGTGTGGNGAVDPGTDTGGGGGGGYTGGGGGSGTTADSATAAGGGGGSSFVRGNAPTASVSVPTGVSGSAAAQTAGGAVAGANGAMTIDWVPCQYTLNLSKTASVTNVNAGAKTVWTVAVRNDGPDPMTKGDVITLTDTLPTGPIGAPAPQFRVLSIGSSGGSNADMVSGAITCTGLTVGGTMPASTVCSRPYAATAGVPGAPSGGTRGLNNGETLTITYEQVFANTAPAASITNTATVNDRSTLSVGADITGTNATRTSAATVNVVPYNLRVSKTASSANINAGGNITWTVVVTNDGPGNMFGPDDTTANALSVSDVAPVANASAPSGFTSSGPAGACTYTSGTITCPGSLDNGQAQTFTFQQTVNGGTPAGTSIANTASVSDFVTGDSNDSGTASVTVAPSANLSVTKTNGTSSVYSGSTITYTVTVTNNGPDSTTGAVVTDVVGAGITCPAGNPVTITGSGVPAGSFNIANLTGAGITLATLNNGQSATLTYSCQVN